MRKFLTILSLVAVSVSGVSDDYTWVGANNDPWELASNWNPNTDYPRSASSTALLIGGAGPGNRTIRMGSTGFNLEIGKIQIDSGFNYRIIPQTIQLLIFTSVTNASELNITNVNGNGSHIIQSLVVLQSPLKISQESSAPFIFTNEISEVGSQPLFVEGTSTVVLGAPNSYSGGTYITGATLSVSGDSHLGAASSTLEVNNGTLLFTGPVPTGAPSIRSGALNNATIDTQGNTVAFSGNFTGTGGLKKQGAGSLLFSGANANTGPTLIEVGTLEVNELSNLGNATISSGASFTIDQRVDGIYYPVVSGSGSFVKTGAGMLHLKGSSSGFTGTTTVAQGELKNNGSLVNSQIHVMGGATLSGFGAVASTTVDAGGTIHVGNSIDVLPVAGNLLSLPGSFTPIDIAPLNADLYVVSGTADFTGSILTIIPEPGFYGFQQQYTILTSAGGIIGGNFAGPFTVDPNFTPALSYTGTDVTLTVNVQNPFASFPFTSANNQSVASYATTLFAEGSLAGDLLNIVNSLAGEDFSNVNDALNQIQPASYSAITEMQMETGAQLISLFRRFPSLCGCDRESKLWIKPFVNFLNIQNEDDQVGFHSNASGLVFGWDKVLSDNFALGLGGAWNRSHIHWEKSRGSGDVNGFYGSLYSNYFANSLYLGAAVLAGVDLYDGARTISFSNTHRNGSSNSQSIDAIGQLSAAYFFGPSDLQFYPYLNLDCLYFQYGSFSEKGASSLNLSVDSRDVSLIRTEIGLGLEGQYESLESSTCLSPFVSLGYINVSPINRDSFTSRFEGAGTTFITTGWDKNWNLLALELRLKTSFKCFDFNVEYHLEMSPSLHPTLLDQRGDISFNWRW